VIAVFLNDWILVPVILILFFVGIEASRRTSLELGQTDPKEVVIDEVVGMAVSLLFLPRTFLFILTAFLLFRVFDIKKPGFIRKMERFPGGVGIMLDDLGAGIMANITIQVFHLLYLMIRVIE